MRKAKVTYYAPEGDNPVVEMGGQRFFDGQSVDLNTDEHGDLIKKLEGNQHFEVELGEEQKSEPKRGPGRPKKSDKDVKDEQKEYADKEGGEKITLVPDGSYQGGPLPGGKTTGIPGSTPLPEGDS